MAGAVPCHKVYVDDKVLAFLDVGQVSRGHSLVIPKGHYVTLDQVPADVAAACGAVLPRLSKAIAAATGATAWNVLQNNGKEAHQAVGHVHFHIIPKSGKAGLGITWPAGKLGADEARELVAGIKAKL